MEKTRVIKKVLKAQSTMEGAGVRLHRVFGFGAENYFDPFLLLDDFRSDRPEDFLPGFPWHPHRGIETITYVLSGDVEHGDSMGNQGVISSGDVQWMTAGSGIIHQEMPKGDERGRMYGFQLWANLPGSHKMMPPRYRDVKREQIPVVALENGVRIQVICGEVGGVRGPVRDIVIDPEYLDIALPPGVEFLHPVKDGHTVFAYVIEGAACFCGGEDALPCEVTGGRYFDLTRDPFLRNGSLALFDESGAVRALTRDEPARFLLVSGKPIGEPVAWRGPIVMNTEEELRLAFEEYHNGTFIKHGG